MTGMLGPQECGHNWPTPLPGDFHVCVRFVNHTGAHTCRCGKSVHDQRSSK